MDKLTDHEAAPNGVFLRFARDERGSVISWFALVLVPILGFTFAAIKFTQLTEQRSGMTDAMDAAGLALARYATLNTSTEECDLAQGEGAVNEETRDAALRYAREYFHDNYPEHGELFADRALTRRFDPVTDLDFDLTCSVFTLRAKAYSDMGGLLARDYGVGAVELDLISKIGLPSAGKVELALVLDVSGSMNGCVEVEAPDGNDDESDVCPQTRIEGLKSAVATMMDSLYGSSERATNDYVRTSVVPFNSLVNANPDAAATYPDQMNTGLGDYWFDERAKAPYHGMNFIHAEMSPIGGREAERIRIGGKTVNHLDLFRTADIDWRGCTEARPFPLDELAVAPGTRLDLTEYQAARRAPDTDDFERDPRLANRAENRAELAWRTTAVPDPGRGNPGYRTALNDRDASRFVPWFYPDEPDCEQMVYRNDCRTYHPDNVNDRYYRYDQAAQYTEEDDFWWPLLDHPSRYRGYPQNNYSNRSFVRDKRYIDLFLEDDEDTMNYRNFLMEYRNSMDLNANDCATNFAAFKGSDYTREQALVDFALSVGATNCGKDEYMMRQGYVGFHEQNTDGEWIYNGKYEHYDYNQMFWWMREDGTASEGGPNLRCGPALLPLTTQKKDVTDVVQALVAAGGTNSAEGMAWGWRMLSPNAPYPDAVDFENKRESKNWRKIVILMTDGQNNIGTANTHMLSGLNAYGYLQQDRLDVTRNNQSRWQMAEEYQEEMDSKTIRICHRMQAEDINVYTIGYAIDTDTSDGRDIEAMLKACANHPEGASDIEKRYFSAADADGLVEVFEDITQQITELHITG